MAQLAALLDDVQQVVKQVDELHWLLAVQDAPAASKEEDPELEQVPSEAME